MKFVNCRQGPLYNSVKSQGHIQYCTVYNTVKPFFQSDGEEEIETETEDTEFGKSNFLKVFFLIFLTRAGHSLQQSRQCEHVLREQFLFFFSKKNNYIRRL